MYVLFLLSIIFQTILPEINMFSLPKSSLINAKIAQFYKINATETLDNVAAYFHPNGAFNAQRIVEHLLPNQGADEVFKVLKNYKYEDYLNCINKLLPIFLNTNQIMKNLNENSKDGLKIQWMGKNVNVYLEMRNHYYDNNKTETVEHILILTSILANALTNVYLTQAQRKHAPHLLKDLINSAEILKVFGSELVIILKILMGSPNSINLRNIVWHGFPKPMEIPNYYINVLLITIHSLGCAIEAKHIKVKERIQIKTLNDHIQVIVKVCNFKPLDFDDIEQKVQQVNNDFKPYWQQLLCYYKSEDYKEFIILILPQIELLLRLHYGQVNNSDISAKLDEYYITMDTIFETQVSNCNEIDDAGNKLLNFEKSMYQGSFNMLYDMFISPSGCRLRDKVSHGEIFLEALNNSQLCGLLLHIFLSLLFPKEFKLFDNYESKLHLNCTTNDKLIKCSEQFLMFIKKHFVCMEELHLKSIAFKHNKVLIFKRPKKEAELMLLINKIAENLNKTILNYEASIAMRSALLIQRELHSKRRKTLEKLQTALPDIFKTLCLIVSCISKIFNLLQNNYSIVLNEEHNCNKTLRFLKHCLKISENFVKYSHCDSNEWIKALELCRKYEEFHKKLFLYDD